MHIYTHILLLLFFRNVEKEYLYMCVRYVRVHARGDVCELQINGNNICFARRRCCCLLLARIILAPSSVDLTSLYREKKASERERERERERKNFYFFSIDLYEEEKKMVPILI